MDEKPGMNPFPSTQRPSIGRIVIYRHEGPNTEDEDRAIVDFPAIIRRVNVGETPRTPTTVDLCVFGDEGPFNIPAALLSGGSPDAATIGDEPPEDTWRWPERV